MWFTNGWYYFWDKCVGTLRANVLVHYGRMCWHITGDCDWLHDRHPQVCLSGIICCCKITLLYSLMLSIYNYCCCWKEWKLLVLKIFLKSLMHCFFIVQGPTFPKTLSDIHLTYPVPVQSNGSENLIPF